MGAATVTGRLYDLGQYPGLVISASPGDVVSGEILQLSAPWERLLRALDQYEGIVPGNHPHNEYQRRLIEAKLESGDVLHAWTYVYLKRPRPGSLIESGSWLQRR